MNIRRTVSAFLLAAMMLVSHSAAYAETQTKDVTAKHIPAKHDNTVQSSMTEGGTFEAAFEDVTVTVDAPNELCDYSLVVKNVTKDDLEAFAWFEECSKPLGNVRDYFYIYFINQIGEKVDVNKEVTVKITYANGHNFKTVNNLSTDGTLTKINADITDKDVTFNMYNSGYFVLAGQRTDTGSGSEAPNESGSGGGTVPPTTGTFGYALYAIMVIIPICMIIFRKKEAK